MWTGPLSRRTWSFEPAMRKISSSHIQEGNSEPTRRAHLKCVEGEGGQVIRRPVVSNTWSKDNSEKCCDSHSVAELITPS